MDPFRTSIRNGIDTWISPSLSLQAPAAMVMADTTASSSHTLFITSGKVTYQAQTYNKYSLLISTKHYFNRKTLSQHCTQHIISLPLSLSLSNSSLSLSPRSTLRYLLLRPPISSINSKSHVANFRFACISSFALPCFLLLYLCLCFLVLAVLKLFCIVYLGLLQVLLVLYKLQIFSLEVLFYFIGLRSERHLRF